MTDKQICRYTALVARKAEIYSRYSGIHWKPEYGAELEKIDRELSELRPLVEQEHQKRKEGQRCTKIYDGRRGRRNDGRFTR